MYVKLLANSAGNLFSYSEFRILSLKLPVKMLLFMEVFILFQERKKDGGGGEEEEREGKGGKKKGGGEATLENTNSFNWIVVV